MGVVLQTQGDLTAARAAFAEYLAISRRLAEQDPGNAGWRRDLAGSCVLNARTEAILGHGGQALALYVEAQRLFASLTKLAPGFVQWQEERRVVEGELLRFRAGLTQGGATPPTEP
jgi:hypothetical protein